eukprot:2713809-Prymnesium_polylepis.1
MSERSSVPGMAQASDASSTRERRARRCPALRGPQSSCQLAERLDTFLVHVYEDGRRVTHTHVTSRAPGGHCCSVAKVTA